MEVLVRAVKQEKDGKGIRIGKEKVKLSLFASDILCIKNPNDSVKETEFNKVAEYKLTYKNQ